ncbi:MAG: hypothetical protein FWE14_04150 [Lachnospiraceae bacterium]|nr:hypothetical protein [Lachnospiraceae bacterium]
MDKEALLYQIRAAKGQDDCFSFCRVMYQYLLKQVPDEKPEVLAWFFKTAFDDYGFKKEVLLSDKLENQLNDYSFKYEKLIWGLINYYSVKGYTEREYYNSLWNSIEILLPNITEEEKVYCLYKILWNIQTPYYALPVSMQLSNIQFSEILDDISLAIKHLDYAFKLSGGRVTKTGLASHMVYLLDKLDTVEQKSVLLVYYENRLEKLWKKDEEIKTGSSSQIDKKPSEPIGFLDKSITAVWTNNDPCNDEVSVKVEELAFYKYPTINNDEYYFLLIKKGEDVFISDQGKTYEQLDKIFVLKEPDVIKNLVAILKQYGVQKQGKEFVLKIDNWDGNLNEDENESLRKGKLSLFSCVSFMLNMKIFYE